MIALSSMTKFCSGFEQWESEWIFSMYPARRHLSNSKVSFDTAVRSHLLAALFYGADSRFVCKAECWYKVDACVFGFLELGFQIFLFVFGLEVPRLRS